jgi:hypothetical protein
MKIIADNRNLVLGLACAIAAVIGWALAADIYQKPLGAVQIGGRFHDVTLEQLSQYKALFAGEPVEKWLGSELAHASEAQQRRYRGVFTAALVAGFFTVFFLGLHFDLLRADRLAPAAIH